ncbi:MAG: TolC family protein [candidate division Zixibacteria bacterium]|nr:TolC family protein [candidate division Zixibacteria bacterium]
MIKNTIICFVVCLLLTPTSRADSNRERHALDSLIKVALERNPTIHAAQYKQSAAEHRNEFAGWLPDPKLTAAILNLPRTSLSFDETPMSGVALGLSQTIPWPGKLSARADIARLGSDIKAMDLAARQNNVIRQVTHYYYDYSHWDLVETVLTESMQLVEDITRVAQTRYANGNGSLQDVLRSETSKARIENRILMARQKAASALVQIARLTDQSRTTDAALVPALPSIPRRDMEIPLELSNPILAKASIGLSVAARKVDLARSEYWPNLTVGIDYRIRKDIPMDAVSGEDFLSFKVGLSLPVWFFTRQRNQTSAARQSFLAAQADEHTIINRVERQIADTKFVLKSLRERTAQYDRSILPQALAASEAAQVAYEVGRVDFNGFLSAQLDVMNIELERLELLKQYHQRTAALSELAPDSKEVIK